MMSWTRLKSFRASHGFGSARVWPRAARLLVSPIFSLLCMHFFLLAQLAHHMRVAPSPLNIKRVMPHTQLFAKSGKFPL